jgi:hypothetical protein
MAHSRPHTLPSGVIQRGIVLTDVEAIWGFDRASLFHQGVQKNLQQRRPLKNAQFCSRSRMAKILTAGIHDKYFED